MRSMQESLIYFFHSPAQGKDLIREASRKACEVQRMVEGYCMKCKAKRVMANATPAKMANGKDCIKGSCSVCKTNMFKIGKA